VDVSEAENPQKELLKALKKHDIQEAVIRLVYKIRSEQLELINTNQLDEALKTAHSYSIRAELISQLTRPRLPELGVGNQLDPMEALKAYIDNKKDLRDIVDDMLEAAQLLLNQLPEIWLEEETSI
jgi:exonuclease SbcD